jgi:tetratricopeptide (TPR) repeat protein
MDPGASLGPYAIDRELGSGGMGKVYAATGPDGAVALKVVHAHLLETPGFFKRFLREAQLGQSIRHENVVRTLDCDQEFADGKPQCFLVMEYVEGQTLADLLGELERVPEELCRHVAREICKGLAAVHDAGVVHRDLKPENVLITPDHIVKVMDLGVAQIADEAMRLSRTGAFVGSVEYAAPEQFKGGDVDGRTDLHALGVLLYELATGVHPYRGGSFHEVLGRVCDDDPRRLGEVNPQLSAFFEEVVHTLLVKDPRGRFSSATQLLDVLQEGEDSPWWHERARALQAGTSRPIRRIRIPRETAVYGREAELAKLRELYELAKSGEGQVVLIDGEAGIGKSRLVDEFIGGLHEGGEDLNFLFGSYPPGGAATADGAFSAAYREHLGEAGSSAYLPDNQLLVPAFDALLRGEGAPEGAQGLTTGSLQTCFARTTQSLAAERVTVVLIDDLHFAPEDGRALFSSLAMATPEHRVLLIGSTRPGAPEAWRAGLTRLAQVTLLSVPRLGPKDLVRLLADSLGSAQLAEDLAGKIALKSDGNPFFAFEIIRGLREGQFITQNDDGTWASTRVIDEIQIPSSVLELVNARVAGLTQEERDLLDMAACWGYEFDPGLVAEAVGAPLLPTLKAFGQIERQHRLVRASGRRYVFDHHQVQEALYASVFEQVREVYHAALAAALEARADAAERDPIELDGALCVDLCEQYLKGARGESALRYLATAQTHLSEGYLNAQVIALTERALAVPGLLTGTERAKALLRLAGANGPLDLLGRRTRQEECAQEAERLAEEAKDEALHGQASAALGNLFYRIGRHEEAEAAFRRTQEVAHASGDQGNEANVIGNLGTVFLAQGRLPEAQEHFERALAFCREIRHRGGEALFTGNLGIVFWSQGQLPEAQEHFERSLALCREVGNREGEANATLNLGSVLTRRGRLCEARERCERALALSSEIGYRQTEANATANLGNISRTQGRLPEAQEYVERALALCREIGHRHGEANALGSLGSGFLAQGRVPEAQDYYERSLALSREIGSREHEAIALVNLGPTWLALGDREQARAFLEASVALCREIGARYPEGYGLRDLGNLADEEGDAASARRFLEQSIALRREIGHGDGVVDSLISLGGLLLREGEVAEARALLEEALALSREQGRQASVAHAQCLLARLPGGDAEAARSALAEAAEHERSSELWLHLWKATGDRTDLEHAKCQLDAALAKVPAEYHESMCTNVRINRDSSDDRSSTESPTRAG